MALLTAGIYIIGYMTFQAAHRAKLHSINPLEMVNGEIKRPTEVVGIFPNEDAIDCLAGRSCLSSTASGRSSAAATCHWKLSPRWAMIPPSASRQSPADRSGPCRRTP
jgi:hypothetical protein